MAQATGKFYDLNGQIIDPSGNVFVAKGLNVRMDQLSSVVDSAGNGPLLSYFPGLNMVRVNYEGATGSGYSTAGIDAQVKALTAKGVVVEIEDHTGISSPPYTGSALNAELAWYFDLAAKYKDNPYVWFGTYNEPGNGTNLAGIAAQESAIYNAVRSAGDTNPVMLEEPSGGNPGLVGSNATGYDGAGPMPSSTFAGMTNVIWDLHSYGWSTNFSTNLATVENGLTGSVSGATGILGAQSIQSADGLVPVIIGEFGNSTTGGAVDPNGDQVIQAVANSGKGFLAWGYNPDEQGDQAVTDSGQLTHYGQQIAAIIGNAAPPPPVTSTPGPTAPPSANDTIVTAGSGAAISDSSGHVWTINSSGVVLQDGQAAGFSANVVELAYVNGTVWQENAAGGWWSWSGGTWAGGAGGRSPLPVATTPPPTTTPTPTPTPPPTQAPSQASANDTVVRSGSPSSITDAKGTAWTITANGQIAVNGISDQTTKNVTELAYVDGKIWQENSSNLWWSKTAATDQWGPAAGTSVNPLPTATPVPTPPPTPVPTPPPTLPPLLPPASPNDTVVHAGSLAPIIDANGNIWSIAANNTVAENGAPAGFSANVSEIAYVNGSVWQENTAGGWWQWNGAAWGPQSVSGSPLPQGTPQPTPAPTPQPTPQPTPTPTPGPTPIPTSGASMSITQDNGTTTPIDTSATRTTTVGDASVFMGVPGVAAVALGTANVSMAFSHMIAVGVAGGAGHSTISATDGINMFNVGTGSMDVTGGSGPDAYEMLAGSGNLTIEDFSVAKGDTLALLGGLAQKVTATTDGSDGTLLTFGGAAGSVDLKHVATMPQIAFS